jgi:RNA polymerase sigma-70 factor (ECF subfamily)
MKRGLTAELVERGEELGTPRPTSPDPLLVSDPLHAHGRRLVGALRVFTDDVGQAEELAQEAFARGFAARGRIRDSDRAQSCLYSTAFNLARSG